MIFKDEALISARRLEQKCSVSRTSIRVSYFVSLLERAPPTLINLAAHKNAAAEHGEFSRTKLSRREAARDNHHRQKLVRIVIVIFQKSRGKKLTQIGCFLTLFLVLE
jgi:hypothetical protein